MNNKLSLDTKKKWFLWGMTFAWIPFIPTIIGIFNSFKGISENKATGLAAVAGGLAEGYATLGLILTLAMPVTAIVLLGKSLSRLHPTRALLSCLSICGSVLVLVLSGLSVWVLFIHTSQAASVPR
jgi:hypothetical protein